MRKAMDQGQFGNIYSFKNNPQRRQTCRKLLFPRNSRCFQFGHCPSISFHKDGILIENIEHFTVNVLCSNTRNNLHWIVYTFYVSTLFVNDKRDCERVKERRRKILICRDVRRPNVLMALFLCFLLSFNFIPLLLYTISLSLSLSLFSYTYVLLWIQIYSINISTTHYGFRDIPQCISN